jgi:hypothetical protein
MDLALVDTDILSEVLRAKNPDVIRRSGLYIAKHRRFALSRHLSL